MTSKKLKIGIFNFASCEGCIVEILNLEEKLLDLLRYIDIVESRVLGIKGNEQIDVALVEGCITCEEEREKLEEIRNKSKIVVALGDCACSGGKFLFKDFSLEETKLNLPPGKEAYRADAIDKYIKVDYYLRGCPINNQEFVELIKDILLLKQFREKPYSVCSECILYEKDCLIDKGYPCLGPITKGGCNALCPSNNKPCYGCRGLYEDANIDGLIEIFRKRGIEVPEYLNELKNMIKRGEKCE